MSARHRRLLFFVGGALALAALTARFGSAASLSLSLPSPALERWLHPLLQEPARREITLEGRGRTLAADLYHPPRPRGALLLVHGLSPAGRRHPELVRLAHLLARHGQLVMVPHFEGLAAFRLSGSEVGDVRLALGHLQALHAATGLAGFSFGAGPALLAAADSPGLRLVGSFGGYADLRHVVAFITTGAHTFAGRRYVQAQEEYNRWKLLALLADTAATGSDRATLTTLAGRRLADPSADTRDLEVAVGEQGRALLDLILNRDEAALPALLARLPLPAREAMDRLSPLAVVPRLPGRLLLAHGVGDRSIPFTESLRLAEAAGGRARLAILRTFEHTGPRTLWGALGDTARDGWALFGLADEILRAG
jgi:hypothetical protein